MIRHALRVDKVIRSTRKELEEDFANVVFTPQGYRWFKRDREKFLEALQREMLKRVLDSKADELLKIGEEYHKEMLK